MDSKLLVWGLQVGENTSGPHGFTWGQEGTEDRRKAWEGCAVHLSKPTLMVVDDDDLMLETLRKLLSHFGFSVVAYSDSVMALAALQQRADVAVLVCDYDMPEMNGEELARAAKRKSPNMPVFVLSGSYPPDRESRPWDAWFLKGAPITELIRGLNAAVPMVTTSVTKAHDSARKDGQHEGSYSVS